MGEVESIQRLLNAPGMLSQDIQRVVAPSVADRDRCRMVQESNLMKPGLAEWRLQTPIGAQLPSSDVVRANFFQVNTDRVPSALFKYAVHIYSINIDGSDKEEVSQKEDERINTSLLSKLRTRHPEWQTGIGFGYDGKSMLMTSHSLHLPNRNADNEPFLSEMIGLPSRATGEESTRKRYRVAITEVCRVTVPVAGSTAWTDLDQTVLQNLDVNLVSFIRALQNSDSPAWSLIGPKIFATTGPSTPLIGAFVAKCGYYSTLKSCLAGLVLNVDLSVNVFVNAGPVIEIMHHASTYRSLEEFHAACARPLPPVVLQNILEALKNVKIRTKHTGFDKKVVDIGPAADSPESAFDHDGRRVTVAQYFELMCRDNTKPMYRQALSTGKLKYPKLPTINIGSKSRPILVPAELCNVITPQARNNVVTPEMTAQIIRVAAMRPNDRMRQIVHGQEGSESIVSVLTRDANNRAIGLGNINPEPMAVAASLLPPAEIQYQGQGPQSKVHTGLRGEWKMEGKKFYSPPPGADASRKYKYGVLLVSRGRPDIPDLDQKIATFQRDLEKDGISVGLPLLAGGAPSKCPDREERIREELTKMQKAGAKLVVCVMIVDGLYGLIKKVSDVMGLVTQCIFWKVIDKNPSGLFVNLLLKIQTKLGGTNHVLSSRTQTSSGRQQFQEPPSSIAWVMEKPCMLLGIDVSHPEPGSDKPSMAAIVASMDGKLSQYCAHLSAQTSRQEMVSGLEDAVVKLLETFRARNRNVFPETIIVYRDGVSEGQYDQVLQQELPRIHGALERCGFIPNGQVKVTIVVCQKRHHTRLVYEERSGREASYINPCPGLVVDARGRDRSIVSGALNEFYLNSHTAIQGTSKPCKYTLIYDEIGFRVSELELLTYWTTYLYARCNRSVSYATPAYYAHWASQRAKDLSAAGASPALLQEISDVWCSSTPAKSTMFFI